MIDNNSVYSTGEAAAQQESLGRYTAKTYLWMFAGLGVTFLVAVALAATGLMERLVLTAPGVMSVSYTHLMKSTTWIPLSEKVPPPPSSLFSFHAEEGASGLMAKPHCPQPLATVPISPDAIIFFISENAC